MTKTDRWTKVLASVGTVLLWFPILTPVVLTLIFYAQKRIFRFDYLMPAELFGSVLLGGVLLFWASRRAGSRRKLVGWGLVAAVVLLAGAQGAAVATGLAHGDTEPSGWPWWLVLSALWGYSIAVLVTAVAGLLLLRDLRKPSLPPSTPA
jgi:hypothetical protein